MGMIGNFLLVTDEEVRALHAAPHTIHELLEGAYEAGQDDLVDTDKAWHCLHFLLTGTAWEGEPPLNFVVAGGEPVGEEDVGYGCARAFDRRALSAIADALDPIDQANLAQRFDAAQMGALEIYPGGWTEIDPQSEGDLGYFLGAFEQLKSLCIKGRKTGMGLVVWIC